MALAGAILGLAVGAGAALAASGSPDGGVLDGRMYFSATGSGSDAELWRTNGTGGGTTRFKDINPGPQASGPGSFARLGRRLIFDASDGAAASGSEPWRTNGTSSGTKRIKDIVPGPGSSGAFGFTRLGKLVLFAATTPGSGYELWRTDGTGSGTRKLKEINPGPDDSIPVGFVKLGKRLYFKADDGTSGSELWRTDGTKRGTKRVKDINPGTETLIPRTSPDSASASTSRPTTAPRATSSGERTAGSAGPGA